MFNLKQIFNIFNNDKKLDGLFIAHLNKILDKKDLKKRNEMLNDLNELKSILKNSS